eukprot:SAG11_NODE_1397_length_5032_cov_14.008109_7_plen_136_part_00
MAWANGKAFNVSLAKLQPVRPPPPHRPAGPPSRPEGGRWKVTGILLRCSLVVVRGRHRAGQGDTLIVPNKTFHLVGGIVARVRRPGLPLPPPPSSCPGGHGAGEGGERAGRGWRPTPACRGLGPVPPPVRWVGAR